MKTLSERISLLLEKADNSVTSLAKIAGVKPPSVSDWLNGKTKSLKAASAIRMARHFNINVLWLTEGIGQMARAIPYLWESVGLSNDISIQRNC
ncbi:MAG: helix-turn-helix transcriptional regulator [Deltaproteobacteria bacterium]|nr:helix-turn-helix transcriptional regulator [Deltaproteobacteria bacterium]